MAEAQHPAEPGGHVRVIVHQRRGHRGALEEPEAVGQGEVGDGRLTEEEVPFAALQLLLQPAHQHRPVVAGLFRGQARGAAAGEQLATVGEEGLLRGRRQLAHAHGDGFGLEHQGDGMLEDHRIHPLGEAGDVELLALREQRRTGLFRFQAAGDQRGVAINVGAHLQHRGLAVATGQRHQVRLGHDPGDFHRAPRQLLVAEHEPRLLGKGRGVVVVQDEFGHGRAPLRLV
ncbi:hypothetical protein D3C85_996430 [compost metagenome]